jgi:hypothetical protein
MPLFVFRHNTDGEVPMSQRYTEFEAPSLQAARDRIPRMRLGPGTLMVPDQPNEEDLESDGRPHGGTYVVPPGLMEK